MLIYGSRMYGVKNKAIAHGSCEHCGEYVRHKSYEGRKWGHIYFIPLIPMGKAVRVLKECPRCNRGQHVDVEQLPAIREAMKESLALCMQAAAAGQHSFNDGEEDIDNGPFLANATRTLHAVGFGDEIPEMLRLLESVNARYELAVATAHYQELQGKLNQAIESIQGAIECEAGEIYPVYYLATLYQLNGNAEATLEQLEKCNQLLGGNDPGIMLEMCGPLEAVGRYDELVALMEKCISMEPSLEQDKKFMKHLKKMRKKAG